MKQWLGEVKFQVLGAGDKAMVGYETNECVEAHMPCERTNLTRQNS